MSRLHLTFACKNEQCAATLDTAPGTSGLFIVTGGNEVRAGAFRSQARLAQRIARAGFPVFRFDRRGVGDSGGENRGFRSSSADIASALGSFRGLAPHVERVVGFGNCDAASALMLGAGFDCDALLLSNPWTVENEAEDAPPMHSASSLRARYWSKLRSPGELGRLLRGQVDLAKLAHGIRSALGPRTATSQLGDAMTAGLRSFGGPCVIALAGEDRTAQLFDEGWAGPREAIVRCPGADHAYSSPRAQEWLDARILELLRA